MEILQNKEILAKKKKKRGKDADRNKVENVEIKRFCYCFYIS